MKRFSQIVLAAALFFLFAGARASAAPILITGGFLLSEGRSVASSPSTMTGTNGFSLTTSVAYGVGSGQLDALAFCNGDDFCAPGKTISLAGLLTEPLDYGLFKSSVTFNGTTYTDFGIDSNNQVVIKLFGTTIAPEFGDLSPRTVSAPFTMEGAFVLDGVSNPYMGQGIATVWLTPGPVYDGVRYGWDATQVRYDFQDASAVPEPSSMMLLGSGLMALTGARRRRRDRAA